MKHLGDITKLHGAELPPVDVVIGGSPCQDLSIAGRREGLAGERSGLFMEQIRIIKEMRDADRDRLQGRTDKLIRPRYAVWENVPGAFSSNKSRDFQQVLTEFVRIAEPDAPAVPLPEKGTWPGFGVLMGDGWSIAWRILDAQYWGVPQRRKRIALVADFGGQSAGEVLAERESLSRDSAAGGTAGKGIAADSAGGVSPAVARSLTARHDGSPCVDRGPEIILQGALNPWDSQNARVYSSDGAWHSPNANENGGQSRDSMFCIHQNQLGEVRMSPVGMALNTNSNASGRNSPLCFDARGNGNGEIAPTLTGEHEGRVTDYMALCVGNGQLNQMSMAEQANTLDTMHDQQAVMVSAIDCRNGTENYDVNGTLQAKGSGGSSLNLNNVCRQGALVRSLTPLECERLQGYPDRWTDIGDWVDGKGKRHKAADSPRYRALGNSIALPPWKWVLKRISARYERDATMGSLFDGIGGFPLLWMQLNGGIKSVPWVSEIEPFCIAVTKRHFGDEDAETVGDWKEFIG